MDFSLREVNYTRRYGGLGIVILLHVLLAYVVLSGLARKTIDVIKEPIVTKIIEEVTPPPPQEKPPPEPLQEVAPPPPFIPPPDIQIQQTQNVIADTSTVQPVAQTLDATPPSVALAGPGVAPPVPGFADLNGCRPEYPRASLLAEEAGTVRVQFDVSADARLVGAKIIRSSGFKNLDRAAVNALSRCKFRAAFQDGATVPSSFLSDYVWKLR
jgi:protein TonB